MTGSWWKRIIIGLAIAVIALLYIPLFSGNGQFYQPVVWPGIAAGAVLALVPGAGVFGRVMAFLFGGGAATLAIVLRALAFPQTPTGSAMAAAFTVIVVTFFAVITVGYWPMWAGLLAVMVVEAAYASRFNEQPTLVVDDLVPYLTPALGGAAITFVVVQILQLIFGEDRLKSAAEKQASQPVGPDNGPAAGEAATGTMTTPVETVNA